MAQERRFYENARAFSTKRDRPSWKSLILYALLFAVLLVFSQIALAYICGFLSSMYPWLIGTPFCYLLLSGCSAFVVTGLQKESQERRWGWISGLLTSIFGMLLGSIILISFVILTVKTFQTSPRTPTGHLPGPGMAIIVLVFFVPIFLLVNLGSIFPGLLGGWLGGLLRLRLLASRRNKGRSVPTYPTYP